MKRQWSRVTVAAVVGVVAAVVSVWSAIQSGEVEDKGVRVFTKADLGAGADATRLMLAILGAVFDVTEGKQHYGSGGGYSFFTGRDASRAFVTGDFTEAGLIDDVHDLTRKQWKELVKWRSFFADKYTELGVVGGGPFYDDAGEKRALLLDIEATGASVETDGGNGDNETRSRRCNKRWNSGTGGVVWCEDGYPRAVTVASASDAGVSRRTCECVVDASILDDAHQLYSECDQFEKSCAIV